MDKTYAKLFKELAHAAEILAEQVMDYDKQQNDEKGFTTAQTMRDDFAALADKLDTSTQELTKADFAKLLVAAFIVSNNINDRIKAEQKAVEGYKVDIIPKLSRINDETKTDDEALKLANEIFIVKEES